ncbi:MAG: hypothetical protein VX770_08190 [Candidatus Neomarinimicrobiota bacterium]|jgi:hypothetical protein|nr:hypothetical protein [Candidatus Neomarinimicrobiota bacterium]|tara:strand:- start:834 stop:1106 length:273 start_codon:yes stop_codon:yes gene_type:complete
MIPFLLFIIFIATIFYTIQPLFMEINFDLNEKKITLKVAKKRQLKSLLKQIREIEFERDMGIISKEDFIRTNNELRLEASKIINEIDKFK